MKKMKKMKRIISLALVIAALAGTGGCAGKKNVSENSGEVPTLVWYVPGNKQVDMKLVMEEANKIIEPKIGAKLDLQMIDDAAFSERMSMMMASNTEFDLCFTGYINPYVSGVRMGGFAPMTELMEKYTPEFLKTFPDYALKSARVDGDIYAVPNLQIMAQYSGVFVFDDYYEKYGFDKIEKIDDVRVLEPCFDKILKNEKNVYPVNGAIGNYSDVWIASSTPLMCIKKNDPEMKVIWGADMDNAEESRKLTRDWYLKGYIRPDIDTCPSDSEELKAGRYVCFSGRYKPGIEEEYYIQYGRRVHFIPMGEPIIPQGCGVDTMTAISRTSKHKDKAMQFIELINTDKDLYNLICYGIKDKHYTLQEDGLHISPIENSGYSHLAAWKFGNQFNAYLLEGQADNTWEETKRLNETAEICPLLGLTFETDNIKSQLSQLKAANEEFVSMHKGAADYTVQFPEYRKKMEDAGIYDVIAEYQRQIDEFLKENK